MTIGFACAASWRQSGWHLHDLATGFQLPACLCRGHRLQALTWMRCASSSTWLQVRWSCSLTCQQRTVSIATLAAPAPVLVRCLQKPDKPTV